MAGGTKLTASKTAAVLILTEAPNTIPATTTRVTAANQASIALDRVIPFNMLFTLYSGRRAGGAGLRCSEWPAAEAMSVNSLWRRFELDDLLTGLGVAPSPHRALEEPTLLRRAILLDQFLDAGKPFRRADRIDFHPRAAYLRPSVHTVLDCTAGARRGGILMRRPRAPGAKER